MELLEQNRKAIHELCKQHKVKELYAFGSVLTPRFSAGSDVDMLVVFEPIDLKSYADNYYSLKFSLEKLFKKSVDLLEHQAIKNPYFKKSLDKQRQLIYG